MNHSCARGALIIPVAAALVLGGAACTNDRTDTSTSTSQTTSAAGGSTHDRVEKLLDEAEEAFDAPARTSSAGNTDKTVDNMSIVADRLMQAHELAPYRNDLLFSAASAQIARKDVDAALALYKTALATAPNDVDAQSYLAGWSRHLGRRAESENYVDQIRALEPARAEQLEAMFATIDQKVSTPLTDALPALPEPGLAIVTLGYALKDDGSMDDILIARLQQTKAAAQRWPSAGSSSRAGWSKPGAPKVSR